jgi:glycopeptide antibiotics resistance protein
MDTMDDIILNFIGGLLLYAVLCAIPYRHRGKNDINKAIEAQLETEKQQEAAVQ